VEFARSVVVHGRAVAFAPPIAVIDGKDFLASTHAVMRGKAVEKMFASRLTSPNGGGSSGIVRPTPTSTVSETLASTRVNMPSERRLSANCMVWFANGADGVVVLLLLPQSLPGLVDSLASNRGRFMDTKASALSFSRKSKPIGMVGLKARPRRISVSVMFTLNGSGVRVDPGKPLTPLSAMLVSSRRMLELSGIYTCQQGSVLSREKTYCNIDTIREFKTTAGNLKVCSDPRLETCASLSDARNGKT
jgi:hypothetical protein